MTADFIPDGQDRLPRPTAKPVVVKALYKPVGLLLSVFGGLVAGAIFKRIWARVAHEQDSPNATDRDRGWAEVIAAAAIQGAVFGTVRAITDRAGATGFERATGVWPGDVNTDVDSPED